MSSLRFDYRRITAIRAHGLWCLHTETSCFWLGIDIHGWHGALLLLPERTLPSSWPAARCQLRRRGNLTFSNKVLIQVLSHDMRILNCMDILVVLGTLYGLIFMSFVSMPPWLLNHKVFCSMAAIYFHIPCRFVNLLCFWPFNEIKLVSVLLWYWCH
jgi:hypothetical protein